jgi:hypothetical protein
MRQPLRSVPLSRTTSMGLGAHRASRCRRRSSGSRAAAASASSSPRSSSLTPRRKRTVDGPRSERSRITSRFDPVAGVLPTRSSQRRVISRSSHTGLPARNARPCSSWVSSTAWILSLLLGGRPLVARRTLTRFCLGTESAVVRQSSPRSGGDDRSLRSGARRRLRSTCATAPPPQLARARGLDACEGAHQWPHRRMC